LADNIVKLNIRDLEALFNSAIRALAKAGVFAAKVTGIVDATDLETTEQSASQHPLPPCAMKRTVLDQCNPLNVHMLALSLWGRTPMHDVALGAVKRMFSKQGQVHSAPE
jgi:hypothetical protein